MSGIQRYHVGAIILHWVVALFLLATLFLGLFLDQIPNGPDKFTAYQLHKSLGISVLLLGVFRLIWRLTHKVPALPADMPAWEKLVAHVTHWIFYILIIGIPLSGWALVSASPLNIPTMLYGLVQWPHLPGFDMVENRKALKDMIGDVHEFLAYSVLVLFVLHVGAALRHHFIMRDETILRMTPAWMEKLLRLLRGEKA